VWDPKQYARFGDERSRPFHELLGRVDLAGARRVVDLGCGDGALTATLRERWPAARVEGIDSSPEMIEAARRHEVPGELEFRVGTIDGWAPVEPVDVLVSNAALQWVPGHLALLDRLAAALAPGGNFAFQVPGNFGAPTHRIVDELCAEPRWSRPAAEEGEVRPASHEPEEYLAALLALGLDADVWETTYCHVLQGDGAVLEWLKGTRLRPVLAALDPAERDEFLRELGGRLDQAYPPREQGTVLPFRRIFAVARRTSDAPSAMPAIAGLDHVQVAMPAAGEDAARAFYAGALGLAERPKPEPLASRGGCWFRGHDVEIHLGVEGDFRPARKAHVALSVDRLDELAASLTAGGHPVRWDDALAGRRRFYTDDPFGNRLELLERG
jgi:trans-aconitate 2-methyltransferase